MEFINQCLDIDWQRQKIKHMESPPKNCHECLFFATGIGCFIDDPPDKEDINEPCPPEFFLKSLLERL